MKIPFIETSGPGLGTIHIREMNEPPARINTATGRYERRAMGGEMVPFLYARAFESAPVISETTQAISSD